MKYFCVGKWRVVCRSFLIVFFNPVVAFCQQTSIGEADFHRIVDRWTLAHQEKSLRTLEDVYDDTLVYFGRRSSKRKVLAAKKKLFKNYPGYIQNIRQPLQYYPYSSGLVKVVFTAETKNAGHASGMTTKYLLFSYNKNQYRIVGESDSTSDKVNGYQANLGELVESNSVEKNDTTPRLSVYHQRSLFSDLSTLSLFSDSTVEFTVRDITIISSLLLIVFVALIVTVARQSGTRIKGPGGRQKFGGTTRIESQLFQRFVVTLFDPLYFNLMTANQTRKNIDLEFQFRKGEFITCVGLKCVYIRDLVKGSFKLLPNQILHQLQGESSEMELYLIVGIAGKADDPAETYLIPIHELGTEPITYGDLQVYRKYGMFFYNAAAGQLR